MRHGTTWRLAVAIGALGAVYLPHLALAQEAVPAGMKAPVAAPVTNVTPAMLQQAAQSGDWLMYGHN